MTKPNALVFVRYPHPTSPGRLGGCDLFSWIALAKPTNSMLDLQPQDPFDGCCPRCGVAGGAERDMLVAGNGDEPASRRNFPPDINPYDVLAGYPLLVTNHGYLLTS